MNSKRCSVIVPAYIAEDTIVRTLHVVAGLEPGQGSVAVDDGRHDRAVELLREVKYAVGSYCHTAADYGAGRYRHAAPYAVPGLMARPSLALKLLSKLHPLPFPPSARSLPRPEYDRHAAYGTG